MQGLRAMTLYLQQLRGKFGAAGQSFVEFGGQFRITDRCAALGASTSASNRFGLHFHLPSSLLFVIFYEWIFGSRAIR
jgi:hypothetical protein